MLAEHVTDPERKRRQARMRGARAILQRLMGFPGETWEQRWLASGCDAAPRGWIEHLRCPHLRPLVARAARNACAAAESSASTVLQLATRLSRCRVSTRTFLHATGGSALAKLRRLTDYQTALPRQQHDAEVGLARVMIRTGKEIEQITGDDLLYYADVVKTSGRNRREHLLWELLVQLGPFAGEAPTLRAAWSAKGNSRQHSAATLVNRYGIPASGVRDLLVDYLEEIRAWNGLLPRWKTWPTGLRGCSGGRSLQINPEQADLRLAPDVATAWRERLALTTDGRPRREIHSILIAIRSFYRDLAEWSHDDPVRWGVWVSPCPVSRALPRAASKVKWRQKSEMQQRTRMLTPLLPAFVAAANDQKRRTALFLERGRSVPGRGGVRSRWLHVRSRFATSVISSQRAGACLGARSGRAFSAELDPQAGLTHRRHRSRGGRVLVLGGR